MNEETLNQESIAETDDWELPEISDEKIDELSTGDEEENVESKPAEDKGTTESEENKGAEEKPAQETTEVKPFLRTKFNGEERDLTEDEARELAQKGMNYDKVLGRFNELNSELEQIAALNNMDVKTLLGSLTNTQIELEVAKELKSLKEKYPDIENEQVLKELAEKNVSGRFNAKSQELAQQRETQLSEGERRIKEDIAKFRNEYPNLEIDKLDPSVYEDVKKGYGLLEAYQKWELKNLMKAKEEEEKKAAIDKQNAANKSKSLGSTSSVEGAKAKDDFMEGWDSVDN